MTTRLRFAAPAALTAALLLSGCGGREGGPAPLTLGAGEAPAEAYTPPGPREPISRPRPVSGAARRIKVARGESLSLIAHRYHVPERRLIEANRLKPPYKVLAGSTLLIPGGSAPGEPERLPRPAAAAAPPPSVAEAARPERPAHGPAAEVAADVAAATAAENRHPRALRKPEPPPARERVAEKAAPPAKPEREHPGGTFLWPVHGRVLATYGKGADGSRNDGINIAAKKGAPVEAADSGTVAYAGNELRGYGNLILIKHAGGWITAYAHCEQILVKRGQKVGRGQVIARVGATGSVKEPQLHFELRRGNHPVDPRGLLAPLPTAAAGKPKPPGKT